MSIAEKLTTIAENQQKVYDAGYEKGKAEGGGSYDEGYTAGQQAEHTRFMNGYQLNGTRVNYARAFAGTGWTRETARPIHDIRPEDATQMFFQSGIGGDMDEWLAENNVKMDFSDCISPEYLFYSCKFTVIGTVDLSHYSGTAVASLFNSTSIVTIRSFSPPNTAMAATCWQSELRNLTIGGAITKNMNLSRCSKLTDASVQSVIDNLADLTGQTTQTLTFHATVGGKLTDAQKATIAAKNWTLVY